MPAYAELHCLSNFTFLRGASHPEELVRRAHALGYGALALTDECSLAGIVRAHGVARECGLPLIIGAEFYLRNGPQLVVLAASGQGYRNLSALITHGRRQVHKGEYCLYEDDLEGGLSGCLIIWLPASTGPSGVDQGRRLMARFAGRLWVGASLLRGGNDTQRLRELQALSRELSLPVLACGGVLMHRRRRKPLQDLLTAIRLRTPLSDCGYALEGNAERYLRSRERLAALYPSQLLAETVKVAERCRFSLDQLHYEYPHDTIPVGCNGAGVLRQLCTQGMARRWPAGPPAAVRRQVEHELVLIAEMRYEPYFLTVHDIVAFARSRGILCQGRGSAANSAVCYCLGITEVDPARMEMLFERFVSKERGEPPDIDVDFEHERREEVIQYIYEKYGRERAALAATVISYRPRSAVRDVGKALGVGPDTLERLAGNTAWWDGATLVPEQVRVLGLDPDNPRLALLFRMVRQLLGFPRHLSQHVGGFVITRGPLSDLVPVEQAGMPGRTVIQWDKDDLDAMGLLKIDVLALGMLSAMRRTLDLISQWQNAPFSLADIPPEDPQVYAMISRADTVGVFQIESRAQMTMLPRLRPACFYDLVIEVAIIRPGPIQGQMVHPYLRRRRGLEAVTYPSDDVRGVLARTLGVPIFQEQVIKLAMVAAGFSAGEADQLRRAIASWRRRDNLERFRLRLVEGMTARGYDAVFAEQIFEQIHGFGEYGFPESHAASFALLAYASAWMKHHHPAAFTCALLNSQPMGFYAPAQLIQDARRHGVQVRPVRVECSHWDCILETDTQGRPTLRLGMRMVKGLSQNGARQVLAARQQQPFRGTADFVRRSALSRRDREALTAAGALATLAGHRHTARWRVTGVQVPPPLFAEQPAPESSVPELSPPSEAQDLLADYASQGFTLGRHPLALLRPQLRRMGMESAAHIRSLPHGRFVQLTGLVTIRQRPYSAKGVIFVVIEDETGMVNAIVWPALAERQRTILLNARLLGVRGQIQREGEVVHVVAARLDDYSAMIGELAAASRDFR